MSIYFSKPGIASAAGTSAEELWDSVSKGLQNGIKKQKVCIGDEFYVAKIDDAKLKPTTSRNDMRTIQIEELAVNQIANDVETAIKKYGKDKIAVCVGSCDNGAELSLSGHRVFLKDGKFDKSYTLEMQGADYVATYISERFGITGPSCAFSTACSSSGSSIIKGAQLIEAGIADAAIVGGVDVASDTALIGFNSLEAVSSEITNPFSKNRHGITLGEGAAFFVISKEPLTENAPAVKLLGYGESADAYHATSPDPSGLGAKKAMENALRRSGLKASDVDYVNLHGTGTKLNDSMESKAIDLVFGEYKVPVSTTKCMTGHTLGAAAAMEAAVCYEALLNKNTYPVQIWDGEFDPALPQINIVSKGKNKAEKEIKVCMSNTFAFGGANASLILGF